MFEAERTLPLIACMPIVFQVRERPVRPLPERDCWAANLAVACRRAKERPPTKGAQS